MVPRTMVRMPLLMPYIMQNRAAAQAWEPNSSSASRAAGRAPKVILPTVRGRALRPMVISPIRPATCIGPTSAASHTASAAVWPYCCSSGIRCTDSAEKMKLLAEKAKASFQKAGWRMASCSQRPRPGWPPRRPAPRPPTKALPAAPAAVPDPAPPPHPPPPPAPPAPHAA
eukprot:gene1766-2320_t